MQAQVHKCDIFMDCCSRRGFFLLHFDIIGDFQVKVPVIFSASNLDWHLYFLLYVNLGHQVSDLAEAMNKAAAYDNTCLRAQA